MTEIDSELMTLGGGCFWCTEAIFNQIKGVALVTCGYMGGTVPGTPTYREVASGLTGHAEVVRIEFYPSEITYEELLQIFLMSHDPTVLNCAKGSYGSQYRSVIFYHNENQKISAEMVIQRMTSNFEHPIKTEVAILGTFHEAEAKHQNYYDNHPEAVYCNSIITPKLNKLRSRWADKLKNVNI